MAGSTANKLYPLPKNIIRGDTPVLQFPLTVGGLPANLTGYTATFTATASKTPVAGDVPVIQIAKAGDATGTPSFQLLNNVANNATSQLIPSETYYWDLQLSNDLTGTALRIFTPLRGTFGVDTDYNLGTT